MFKGKVRDYDANRGCGSIIDIVTGKYLVFYANYLNLKDGEVLNKGQAVAYDIETRRHENWAINVKII